MFSREKMEKKCKYMIFLRELNSAYDLRSPKSTDFKRGGKQKNKRETKRNEKKDNKRGSNWEISRIRSFATLFMNA